MFETPLWRFATSGVLILVYGVADRIARSREDDTKQPPSPRWVGPLAIVSMTAFYLLIGPMGGSLIGGMGNVIGLGIVALAIGLRLSGLVEYPSLGGRSLFYVALPIAVGVPWGLLALSLPAVVASLYCCHRADQARELEGERLPPKAGPRAPYRMLPGIW